MASWKNDTLNVCEGPVCFVEDDTLDLSCNALQTCVYIVMPKLVN